MNKCIIVKKDIWKAEYKLNRTFYEQKIELLWQILQKIHKVQFLKIDLLWWILQYIVKIKTFSRWEEV